MGTANSCLPCCSYEHCKLMPAVLRYVHCRLYYEFSPAALYKDTRGAVATPTAGASSTVQSGAPAVPATAAVH
jgi:hypothetical protein